MKVRKLAVALALAGGLGSGVAQALGLGEIELQSYLNEPLEADIGLTRSGGVSPSDVFVNLASEGAYRQVGIDRSYFLNKLKFNVTTGADGNLVVNVSTTEPVREPYLNFLLEVTWPSGRLMREYAVLVDPPVYAEDSGLAEQVQAPTVAPAPVPQPAPAPRQTVSAAPRVETAPATSASSGSPATFGPTGPADTLWAIASAVKPNSSVSNQQVMLAIQDLNPDAFIGGNINRMKRGQVLRIPTLDQIQQRTRNQATQEVSLQNQALAAPAARTVDAREEAPVESAAPQVATPVESGGDELKLMVADSGMESAETESGSAGGESDMPGGVDSGSTVVMEELDSARQENEELSGRVEDLQAQVETLQRLLELKNTQLAEFEQSIADREQAEGAISPDTTGPGSAEMTGEAGAVGAGAEEEAASAESGMAEGEPGAVEAMNEAGAAGDAMVTGEGEQGLAGMSPDGMEPEAMAPDAMGQDDMAEEGLPAEPEAAAGMAEEPEPVAPVAESKPEPVVSPPAQPEEAGKAFPQNVIDAIVNNPLYQIALGGGLVLFLLLMLLIARRNANKEKAFYDELNRESEGEDDMLAFADEESAGPADETGNPLDEADVYIAYGRLDQAAHVLETAISKEPSRTDLRLKLLGVYADSEDRSSFEKQFGELEALDDDEATAAAEALRSRLEEAEAAPSIDELESQLMSDSFAAPSEQHEPATEEVASEESESSDLDFGDIDFETPDEDVEQPSLEAAEADDLTLSIEEPAAEVAPESEPEAEGEVEAPIEFDLSEEALPDLESLPEIEDQVEPVAELADDDLDLEFDIDTSAEEESAGADLELEDLGEALEFDQELPVEGEAVADMEDEFASLELGDESLDDLGALEEQAAEAEGEGEELVDLDSGDELGTADELAGEVALDESFLDDLDAELDKVAGDEGEELEAAEDTLEDLELDVSDEDLALMGEVAGEASPTTEGLDLDEELGLEDTLGESAEADKDVPVADEEVTGEAESEAPEPQGEAGQRSAVAGAPEIDEAALGEDDDFDFLAGTDEAATKLDLARAYIEMGDADGARDILEEVAIEGSDEQKVEAQDLLKSLS